MKDYYQILGLATHASHKEIKIAFRRLAKVYHPDTSAQYCAQQWTDILKAYQILSHPYQKKAYDERIRHNSSSRHFNYFQFIQERLNLKYYQVKLLVYYLLHNNLKGVEEVVNTYSLRLIDLEECLSRSDFLDIAYLLSEFFLKKKEYALVIEFFMRFLVLETEKSHFRLFIPEIFQKVKYIQRKDSKVLTGKIDFFKNKLDLFRKMYNIKLII